MAFSLQVIRKFSYTSCSMMSRLGKRSNPGLGHQVNAIDGALEVIEADPEGFAGLESELFNAHRSHKAHCLELERHKEKVRHCLVKNKYFRKEPYPNFLTYAEKEHIRHLHSLDEEEWTAEKLAESFPANVEIIKKILKARWSPLTAKRIIAHDTSVSKNLERFKNGEYQENITSELQEHLKKFADRAANGINILTDPTKAFKKYQWQRPVSKEFSTIITSLKSKTGDCNDEQTLLEPKPQEKIIEACTSDTDTHLLGGIINKTPITIHQLKNRKSFKNINDSVDNNSESNANIDFTEKFLSNEVVISELDRQRYEMSETKPRIYIPRRLWRKGATYRINDCYYDDDGEFLYKVPGMNLK